MDVGSDTKRTYFFSSKWTVRITYSDKGIETGWIDMITSVTNKKKTNVSFLMNNRKGGMIDFTNDR